jgi:hypothetical protein
MKDQYYAGSSDEYFDLGPFDSIEEAVEEYKNDRPELDTIYVGKIVQIEIKFDAQDWLDAWLDQSDLNQDACDAVWARANKFRIEDLENKINPIFKEWIKDIGSPCAIELVKEVRVRR